MRQRRRYNLNPLGRRAGAVLLGFAALAVLFTAGDAGCIPLQTSDGRQGTGERATNKGQSSLPASLEELFINGVKAQKSGQLGVAERAFLEVLRQGGKVAFVYNNLGILYQQRGDYPRALEQFRQAIRLQPDYAAPHTLMGASLLATGKTREAALELERAVKLQPREPLSRLQLARAYERAGNPAGVVDQFRALRELAPQDPEYAYQLGSAYAKLSAWCYRQIQKLDPGSARVYQTLAENYRIQGKADLAVRALERAAKVDPMLPGVHLTLAQVYLEQAKVSEARQAVEQELAIVPESVAALALKQKLQAAEVKPQ
jgi:tetratricopeptide (TPR) repeat protein